MFKAVFAAIAAVVLFLAAPAAGQQRRATYGPVVKAFLSGLGEDLAELEFQIQHREISRADYERTKQRLTVLRRVVERSAARSAEDRVPELQVLADDELGALKPGGELNLSIVQIGEVMAGRWKVVAVERVRDRFVVLEKLPRADFAGVVPQRKLSPATDPRDIIETIIVRVETAELNTPQQSLSATPSAVTTAGPLTAPEEAVRPAVSTPQPHSPRLLHIYLPEYTDKAREKKIEGEVVVRALLQRDGKVKNIKVEKGLGYGLDDRAVAAVMRLGFMPAESEGREVDASAQIVFNFKLGKVTVSIGEVELSKGGK